MLRIEHTQGYKTESQAVNLAAAVMKRLELPIDTIKIKTIKAAGLFFPVVLASSYEAITMDECNAHNIAWSNHTWADAKELLLRESIA